ncbi:hypothetical protein FNV43_RR20856 [Rhamnella rubrinervis]|uniref:Leucine-rich repeat-containing N-terminal plant-type domain-containing protein n=1 Tax=Rhamnella rubrinervis TaxID=2594499 RepID=A0A8K0GXD6_9ROSA|nr:hypothetical protein FNV43_RR20856 [Rhamnella rubrinervis]
MENSSVVFVLLTIATISAISFSNGNIDVLCRESERQALLRFKQDLKDPMNRLSTWDGGDCCSWMGITCDNLTGHVLELHVNSGQAEHLDLLRYGLGGKINPSLLVLKYLKYLDLSGNNFEGIQIPSFIGCLKSLTHLNLSYSGFGGKIPHQLGNLSNLNYLNLGYCNFLKVESLQWMSGLSSLQYMEMTRIDLSKAFDWLQVVNILHSLVELRLSHCELDNNFAPLSVINFTSLVTLDLSFNNLGPLVPMWIFSLSNLEHLNVGSNFFALGSTSFGLKNLTRLISLDMFQNSFNSTIPQWIFCLKHLEYLGLTDTQLMGNIPSAIGNLTSINVLILSSNQLDGNIPNSFGNLCKLKELYLDSNRLSGAILGILTTCAAESLELLYLDDNQLSGLPASLGRLSNLQDFDVSHNQLTGSLPGSLGQLVKLESLDISHNLLEGVVSEVHFSNLTRLKTLYASGNSLTLKTSPLWLPPFQLEALNLNSWHLGLQPLHWIRRQHHLSELQISSAGISGTIPSWFCNFSLRLVYLNLSHNQFHGEFPCTNLSLPTIDLSSNQFNGSLPFVSSLPFSSLLDFSNNSFSGSAFHFFCGKNDDKQDLSIEGDESVYVHLGNNLLSGKIPNCWSKWESLAVLNLQNNNLLGVIPSSMGYLTSLSSLQLRNNNLHGNLPLSLQKCINLEVLDLSENNFVGMIPKWIGISLSSLVVLNLHSNRFQGDVPLELCNLMSLQILDLAQNNVSGTIPRCLCNLSSMTTSPNSGLPSLTFGSIRDEYDMMAKVVVVTKGREVEYGTVLNFVRSMDLSSNNLHGEIPVELTRLQLQTLNLSKNNLAGKIPSKIGDMTWLESLDLSENQLFGEIPPSMSRLTFLSVLNLSYNKFTGPIPRGTQLQSFNESSFIGNQLCGPPLQQKCSAKSDQGTPPAGSKQDQQVWLLKDNHFYLSLGLGFAFGFWCVLGSLLTNMPWSVAICRLLDRIVLKIYGAMF